MSIQKWTFYFFNFGARIREIIKRNFDQIKCVKYYLLSGTQCIRRSFGHWKFRLIFISLSVIKEYQSSIEISYIALGKAIVKWKIRPVQASLFPRGIQSDNSSKQLFSVGIRLCSIYTCKRRNKEKARDQCVKWKQN